MTSMSRVGSLTPLLRCSAALLVCCVACALLMPRAAGATVTPRAEELLEEVRERGDDPLVLAALLEAGGQTGWMQPAELAAFWAEARESLQNSEARAYATYLLMRAYDALGQHERAAALGDELGFVDSWYIVGPFSNDGMSGFETPMGPELSAEIDFEAALYEGKRGQVSWLPFDEATETGYFDLRDRIAPASSSVTYAVAECRVTDRRAFAQLAVDGAYRLWVNGEAVAVNDEDLGGSFARDAVALRLRNGWNRIALKIAREEDGAYGWHVRLTDDEHRSVVERCRLPESGADFFSDEEDFAPVETLSARFIEAARQEAWSASGRADAVAVLKTLQHQDPSEPWRELMASVDEATLHDARALRRLAYGADEHWRRVELLRRAAEADSSLDAALDYLEARAEEMGWDATEEVAAQLVALSEAHPDDDRLALLRARRDLAIGLYRGAASELRSVVGDAVVVPAVCPLLAQAYRGIGDIAAERQVRRRCLAARPGAEHLAYALLELPGFEQGSLPREEDAQQPSADELVARLNTTRGHRAAHQFWLARYERSRSRLGRAQAAAERAAELRPGEAQAWELMGQIALQQGEHDAAVSAYEQALLRRPQDSRIRDLLARLEQQSEAFYSAFMLDDSAVQELRDDAADREYDFRRLVDQRVVRVFDNGLATTWMQRAWQVHTDNGADQLRSMTIGYAPDSELVDILQVSIRKADGTLQEIYNARDVAPYSGPASIYYDVRARQLYFPGLQAGDTLTVAYTISDVAYRNIFDDYFGDVFFVSSSEPLSLARYALIAPQEREIVTNAASLPLGQLEERESQGLRELIYEAREVAAGVRESRSPGASERFDYLHVSTYASWDDLGNWYWNLVRDQLVQSPEMRAQVEELIAASDDRREQVAAIYNYVVRNTRYVGLEFGIHGYKPYRTTQCFSRRFGDCKDTASLIKVMLQIAGIESHLVLVRTRDLGRIDMHPPSLAVFNHAIVYVPEFDLYLDGTAGFSGSRELPGLDQGASAAIILDGEGARTVTIPYLPAAQNASHSTLVLDARGEELAGTLQLSFVGQSASAMRARYEQEAERRRYMQQWLARMAQGVELRDLSFSDLTQLEEPVEIELQFEGGAWFTDRANARSLPALGREVFSLSSMAATSSRALPLELGSPARESHRMIVFAPEGYQQPTAWDEAVQLDSPFGQFSMMRQTRADGALVVDAELELRATRVAPEEYPAFREWVQSIESYLQQPLSFEEAR